MRQRRVVHAGPHAQCRLHGGTWRVSSQPALVPARCSSSPPLPGLRQRLQLAEVGLAEGADCLGHLVLGHVELQVSQGPGQVQRRRRIAGQESEPTIKPGSGPTALHRPSSKMQLFHSTLHSSGQQLHDPRRAGRPTWLSTAAASCSEGSRISGTTAVAPALSSMMPAGWGWVGGGPRMRWVGGRGCRTE